LVKDFPDPDFQRGSGTTYADVLLDQNGRDENQNQNYKTNPCHMIF